MIDRGFDKVRVFWEKLRRKVVVGRSPVEPARILYERGETFVPTYKPEDLLDPAALELEAGQLERRIIAATAATKQTQLMFENPSLYHKYLALNQRVGDVGVEIRELDNRLSQSTTGEISYSLNDLFKNHLLQAGGKILANRDLNELAFLVNQHLAPGGVDHVAPWAELRKFLVCGELGVRFNGLTLSEVAGNGKRKLPLAEVYGFFISAMRTRGLMLHSEVYEDNATGLFSEYPNLAKSTIDSAVAKVYALTIYLPDSIDTNPAAITPLVEARREMVRETRRALERTAVYTRQFTNAFLNPEHSEHKPITEIVGSNIRKGRIERVFAIQLLLASVGDNPTTIYRKSRQIGNEQNSSTHILLADLIYSYMEEMPEGFAVATSGDLDSIIVKDKTPVPTGEATLADLAGTAKLVGPRASKKPISVDFGKIDWGNIVPPQELELNFDRYNPATKFDIRFKYQNPAGENLSFSLTFDLKRMRGDWSILEDPSESEDIKVRYQMIVHVVHNILKSIQEQGLSKEQTQARKIGTDQPAATPEGKKVKIRPVSERIVEARSGVQAITPIKQALQESLVKEAASETTMQIVIPKGSEFTRVTKPLSHKGRQIIKKKLTAKNVRGEGKLKRLIEFGGDGRPRYSFRVGDMRVILKEADSQGTTRRFEIEDVNYRQNSYK